MLQHLSNLTLLHLFATSVFKSASLISWVIVINCYQCYSSCFPPKHCGFSPTSTFLLFSLFPRSFIIEVVFGKKGLKQLAWDSSWLPGRCPREWEGRQATWSNVLKNMATWHLGQQTNICWKGEFLPIKYFQEDVLDLELLTVNKCTLKWIYEAWLPGECHISYTTLLS